MMVLQRILVSFIFFGFSLLYANVEQTESEKPKEPVYGWQNNLTGTLNLTQTALSNWTTGGENAWSWQVNLNGRFVERQKSYKWVNAGKITFGESRVSNGGRKKTDDEIFLETVYSLKVWKTFNPYASTTMLTQLAPGYDYKTDPVTKISDFLDPGYFKESIGFDYEPNDYIKTRVGFAVRQTVAGAFAARYSDDPETKDTVEKFKNEWGVESVTDVSLQLNNLIVYASKLEIFSTVERVDEVVVRWDNLFSAKLAEYISVSLNFKLYYDKKGSVKRQLKQILAVGLTHTFL
jgi:hypothetical protein